MRTDWRAMIIPTGKPRRSAAARYDGCGMIGGVGAA